MMIYNIFTDNIRACRNNVSRSRKIRARRPDKFGTANLQNFMENC